MLRWLTILLLCQWLGEVVAAVSGVPVPGPVIGMLILLAGLLVHGSLPEELATTSDGLLRHLSLLFVPAGVGVIAHLSLMKGQWAPLLGAMTVGTLITMLVTGWIMQWLLRKPR